MHVHIRWGSYVGQFQRIHQMTLCSVDQLCDGAAAGDRGDDYPREDDETIGSRQGDLDLDLDLDLESIMEVLQR